MTEVETMVEEPLDHQAAVLDNILKQQDKLPPANSRQRKVSHRKIIIHDNGEVCAKTYNRVCPHEDDPSHQDPPMYHEAEGIG